MPNNYKPVVVTIYRKKEPAKKPVTKELVLELPLKEQPPVDVSPLKPEQPTRGIQVVNLYGDEKI
jgi:hypothetical protein